MENEYWWLVLAILLILIEIFTPSFFAASLGIGALIASLAGFAGAGIEIQLLVFSIASLLSVFLVRPLLQKYFYRTDDKASNADAIIGRTGTLKVALMGDEVVGRISIDGDEWQCVAFNKTHNIAAGTQVRVVGRDSIILIVEPLNF